MIPERFFETPEEALQPISAGTMSYLFCEKCTDSTGTTIIEIPTPHPTYLNSNGKAVVQLQCVELGGINGLNS